MIENTIPSRLRTRLRNAWRFNPILTLTLLINLLLIPATLLLMLLDPVQITGVNGWVKPFKFALSVSIYVGTLLWLLPMIERRTRTVALLGSSVGIILLVEIAIILLQVLRRTTSHFNNSTPLDAALFSIMGMAITALSVLNLVVAIWLLRQKVGDPVLTAGLRWALWVTFAGMIVAFLMTMPNATQRQAMAAGTWDGITGAHSVGVADGGPGLPVVGWSTTGGDLRVPHFVGLHALQMLPLLAWLLRRPFATRRWTESQRTALVHIGGASYLALLALLTWQALRGQSVIAPDGVTLLALTVMAASATVAALAVLVRRPPVPQLPREPATRAVVVHSTPR
jgi:hypothetical protein